MRQLFVLVLVIALAFLLQVALVSRVNLLHGNADLLLLILAAWGLQEKSQFTWVIAVMAGILVGAVSGVPWVIYLLIYLLVAAMARFLTSRIWQAPLLAMFAVTFVGTLLLSFMVYFFRILFENVPLHFSETFLQVILPGVLLNLILAVGIHPLIRDLSRWLFPAEVVS